MKIAEQQKFEQEKKEFIEKLEARLRELEASKKKPASKK